MAFIGRLHPLLIHFPIALVISAALAEGAAMVTAQEGWRTVAVGNVRAGAVFAVLATIAGWRLALAPEMELSALLEWHRWLGTVTAAGNRRRSVRDRSIGSTRRVRISTSVPSTRR
jgi:uncharacterized membrane protein